MNIITHRPTTSRIAILVACLLFVISLIFVVVSRVGAVATTPSGDGRLVTIHDRGIETVILSNAATVGDALAEAEVYVDQNDSVEPALSEKLVASEYEVNIYRARPVVVIDGSTKQKVITPYQTPQQIAKSAGITLYEDDNAELSRTDDIVAEGAGLRLTIDRALPFTLTLYGKTTESRTQALTVSEMLSEKGIEIGAEDRVSVEGSTSMVKGMSVRVWREGKQTITLDEKVDYDVEQIQDGDRDAGYKEVKVSGIAGERSVTYEIIIEDGKEVRRTEIASITTKKPVTQVEVVGVKLSLMPGYAADRIAIMTSAGIDASDQGYAAYIIDHENASWCPTRWQGQIGCPSTYQENFPGAMSSDQIGYGICQSTPGIKMQGAGSDWKTNPVTQMKWCRDYAISRYGSWQAAYNFKVTRGWW